MPRLDVTKNYRRARQFAPSKCARGSFRTITRGKIKLVICCPRGQWKRGRCRVGTKAQSILRPR
jgi:hypothetical protein